MHLRAKHLLLIWLFGFLLSLAIQSVFQAWFAEVTVWGRNRGWPTEIAIWNTGMSLVLIGLLRQSKAAQKAAVPGLVVLSLAFGTNHLAATMSQPAHLGNWLGAGVNFSGVALASLYYIGTKRSAA